MLQEQLNETKRQNDEKEEIVAALIAGKRRTGLEVHKGTYESLPEIPVPREQLNHYRTAAENARGELAAMQVKYKNAQTELTDICSRHATSETYIQELKAEVQSYKENNARQGFLISCLRERIQERENESGELVTSKALAEVTVQTLQKEKRELQKNNMELETKLRKYLTECDEAKQEAFRKRKEYEDFLLKLTNRINVDCNGVDDPLDFLVVQVEELYKENTRKNCQITNLEETIGNHDVESKASRETIMRLVSEVGREQKTAASYLQKMETLHKDLNKVLEAKHHLERETQILQDRLEASQRVCKASTLEIANWKKHSDELVGRLQPYLHEAKAAQSQLEAFKEQLASLLSSGCVVVQPTEEAVKERIRDICDREENKNWAVSQLEERMSKLTEQLEKQRELHQLALRSAQEAEQKLPELLEKVRYLEGQLLTGDVLHDDMSQDKQKYLRFLEQLSEKMKLEKMTADIGFDLQLDAIFARADQLVTMESEAITENKTLLYNLRRKLKSLNERLHSKELHMDLLRKKIAQLEEEKLTRTALAVERDEANLTVRKLHKKLERLEKELCSVRASNTDLKAKLSDTHELKIKTLEQSRTIEEMNKSLEKLEKLKQKTDKRLISTKSELDFTEFEAMEHKERAKNMLEAVASELKTLKITLVEVAKREKQLVDFREVVSQMLGLNIDTLALPDYEIIKQLERLIATHHSSTVTALCLENPVEKLHQGFVAGRESRRRLAADHFARTCIPKPLIPSAAQLSKNSTS
ncbi:coiled-coil domain-containing protein 170 isoform X1 [Callorhinchus milii]|nr:coiled-coil domain-containing protein 170 isoform X1 [Callorhinchus milii]